MKRRVLTTLVSMALLNANSLAQQPLPTPPPVPVLQSPQKPDDSDVVKITTNLVQVDAVVTDQKGNVVTDLKPEEVQILEDGKPQKITHFAYNVTGTESANRTGQPLATDKSNEVAPPLVPNRLTRENVHRTIAIVADDLGLSFESAGSMRRALKKIVDEQMQPGDLVAIIRTGGNVGALQQFTSDKRQLYAAIQRVKWNLMGSGDTGAFTAIRPPNLKLPDEHVSSGAGEEHRVQVAGGSMMGTMKYVVRGMRDLPGRKSILLLSDGIGLDPYMKDLLDVLIDSANRASVVIHTMDARGLVTLGLQPQDNVQMLSDAASRVDVRGLGRSVVGDRLMTVRRRGFHGSQDGLIYLSQETGGITIRNTNDFSAGVQRVMNDQRGYYLIGYRPDEATFDAKGRHKRHNLSLKVTRPGKFNVRMRNGFFGISEDKIKPAPKTTAQQMADAITSPFRSSDVHLQLTSLFGNDATNGSFMRSFLHIDARDLTFKDGPNGTHECVFDVMAMTFGDNGEPVDQIGQTNTVQLPEAEYQRAMRQGFVFNVTAPIKKPGAYQFRISLRDTATNRIGSAGQFIEVPDLGKKRLALSGVLLSGKTIAAAGGVNSNSIAQNGKVTSGTDPEAGPAIRRLKQMMRLEYGLLIYNATLDKASGKPQFTTQIRLFRDGRQVFSGDELPFNPAGQADLGRLVVAGALELGTDLAPGEYIFQIIVSDILADKKYRVATQWMDFEIIK